MVSRKKSDPNAGGPLQLGFFTPESDWRPTPIVDLPSWSGATRIAIDAETKDPSIGKKLGGGAIRDGYTVGWAFAIEDGPKHYLPIRHEGGDNLPVDEALRYLRDQIKHFDGEFVGANLSYDIDYGYQDGFVFHEDARFRDIQIADPLIFELHQSYSLKNIGDRYGVEAKDESMLLEAARSHGLDPKKGLWRLPARFVGEYGERDVTSPLEILKKQELKIEENDLHQVWDLECRVLPCLVRMRRRGVRIDFDRLDQIKKWSETEEKKALNFIQRETGVNISFGDVWKPGALAPALKAIGMSLKTTATGAPQIDRFLLNGSDHEVCAAILRARKVNKIRETFAKSIEKYAVNGRIHTQFNQIAREDEQGEQKGVRYGRLSSTHPNLQQQPSPDRDPEIAGEWRKIFIPEEGSLWGCNDYSQQEPRWTTHFASVMDLPRAREAARRYQENPDADNHDMMVRLIHGDEYIDNLNPKDYKVKRGHAKNIFLGVCYGEGGPKLCKDLNMSTNWMVSVGFGHNKEIYFFDNQRDAMAYKMQRGKGYVREVAGPEGQEILDNFDKEVPFVRKTAKTASEIAESRGFVKTVIGRRLHFTLRENGSYDYTHKALNRIIQGTSADQAKEAIYQMDREGYYLQLQVHDETDGSFGTVKQIKEAGTIMKDCIKSDWVPFKVDSEYGPSWGELKGIE